MSACRAARARDRGSPGTASSRTPGRDHRQSAPADAGRDYTADGTEIVTALKHSTTAIY